MDWINAAAMIMMIMSGWKIYNDYIIFSWLPLPDATTLGTRAQHGLQWHLFGMCLAYLIYGIVPAQFRRKLFPVLWHSLIATVRDAMTLASSTMTSLSLSETHARPVPHMAEARFDDS
jgi:thiosulfate reductase cytochrome b subunit